MDLLLSVLQEVFTPQGGWSLKFVVRVVVSSMLLYALVILVARTFGARTFASFTSYDFLINIAAGSLVASSILGENLVGGALGVIALAVFQWVTSALSARVRGFHDAMDNPPVVLIRDGEVDSAAMRSVRVSRQSLEQQLRNKGVTSTSKVGLAVFESGGTISVMQAEDLEGADALPQRDSATSEG